MSLNFTLIKYEKHEHHIKIKTYKLVKLMFWIRCDDKFLLIFYEFFMKNY